MAKYRALILAGGALLALTRAAAAADLLPPPPALEPLPPAPVEFNGWYLRGDVGAAVNSATPKLQNTPDPLAGGAYPDGDESFNNTTLSSSAIFDIGVGYQFNSWLRFDVTGEYHGGGQLQSLYVLNTGLTGAGDNSQYAEFYRGNLSSFVGLANAYADLGTWYGVTPYVGGGVGFSDNWLSGMTDQGEVTNVTTGTGPSGGYFSNGSKTNFAWALMAGLSFDVTRNLKLDLGYRYLDYGKFTTGGSNCLNGTGFSVAACGGGSNFVSSKNDLASNDFRIGLRWMIGEETAPPPAPLVRKY